MDKLNKKDLDFIIELLEQEKEKIHKKAMHDEELREREVDLDFIIIKLDSQLKMLE